MKAVFLHIIVFFVSVTLFAQEVITPLYHQQKTNLAQGNNNLLKKKNKNFPVVDFFTLNGLPQQSIWSGNNVLVQNRQVVFNALLANNTPYSSSDNKADELTLNNVNIADPKAEIFISFRLNAGSTFSASDSFIVQVTTQNGNFQTVFSSANTQPVNREVVLSFLPNQILLSGFQVRFICYTSLINSNIQTFLLSNFVLSQKLKSPFFDVVSASSIVDSVPNTLYYNGTDIKVLPTKNTGFIWGNVLAFDMFDEFNAPYATAGYGGGDTLYTNPINILNYNTNDSILFSFAVGFGSNAKLTDSLIVEFRNNLGVWIRVLALGGNTFSGFREYSFNVNSGRFRYQNFSARFIAVGNYNDTSKQIVMVSAISYNSILSLPFIDDFSTSNIKPNIKNWLDDHVLINNQFPLFHPSINVATFDGLDANGNAYTKFLLKGIADVLTSKPFNLSRFEPKDSLILTLYFQYEPQGNTNQVYPDDSLYIEFKTSSLGKDSFVIVRSFSAADFELFTFHRIDIPITQQRFFNRLFQFRIKNRGSLTGNLSHWHLDYIRLNAGRNTNDAINDVALTNTPAIYHGRYYSMPWKQYIANTNAYKNDSVYLRINNMHNQNYAVDYFRNIIKPEGDTLDKFNNIQPTVFAQSDTLVKFSRPIVFNTSLASDSLVFKINYRIRVSGSANDEVTSNDTATVYTVFDNYLAYDDGSAEGGYGIKNKLNAGACLKYVVEVPDTLYGLYIFFNQSETDVSRQRFKIKVWKKISELGMPAINDQEMYSREYEGPTYTNSINGFATYAIDPPLAVSDSFFVGWEQANAFVLNVGLDKNYPFGLNPNHFFKIDGRWFRTEIPGALMIRPVLGKFKTWPTGMPEPIKPLDDKIIIYPNPTNDIIQFSTQHHLPFEYSIFDLTGRKVQSGMVSKQSINVSHLPDGLYLIQMQNHQISQSSKIIIKH